jgi:hypothetical protein
MDEGWPRYGGFDPAIGLVRGHSWCVYTVLAVGSCSEHERCLWVVDQERDTMPIMKQARLILEMHERYGLDAAKVEANGYQAGLAQLVNDMMDRSHHAYRIEGHFTDAQKKHDPEIGIQSLSPWFEHGRIHIPWGDAASRAKMKQLVEELVTYPGRSTDCVMSLWIAYLCQKDMAPRFQSYNRIRRQIMLSGRAGPVTHKRVVKNPYYA